ncbi:MAG: SDR family NAD(P)-dependent oxidoreductase, partial [Dehalococcoidales bacterium]
MGNRLRGKAAVVTGAGRGLGRSFAMALAGEGARVLVNDLGTELDGAGAARSPADDVVSEIIKAGGEAVANYDTVTTTEGGENIIQACLESFDKVDILVNNAGILRDRMVFNMSPEEWDDVIKVHLYGTFNCTRSAAG